MLVLDEVEVRFALPLVARDRASSQENLVFKFNLWKQRDIISIVQCVLNRLFVVFSLYVLFKVNELDVIAEKPLFLLAVRCTGNLRVVQRFTHHSRHLNVLVDGAEVTSLQNPFFANVQAPQVVCVGRLLKVLDVLAWLMRYFNKRLDAIDHSNMFNHDFANVWGQFSREAKADHHVFFL
jgi:hypothetical protein